MKIQILTNRTLLVVKGDFSYKINDIDRNQADIYT